MAHKSSYMNALFPWRTGRPPERRRPDYHPPTFTQQQPSTATLDMRHQKQAQTSRHQGKDRNTNANYYDVLAEDEDEDEIVSAFDVIDLETETQRIITKEKQCVQ